MQQSYYDAMALVAKFGRPDYFHTITANTNCAEIKKNLRAGEDAANRPDLVARVFRQKLRKLLHDLTSKHVLGRARAYTYVVEFQKRGLPHAHILLILCPEHKPRTPDDVDRRVCAERPDPVTQPRLHQLQQPLFGVNLVYQLCVSVNFPSDEQIG